MDLRIFLPLLGFVLLQGNAARLLSDSSKATPQALPVVLWHGMGDSCCASYSIGAVKKHIEETIPGVFVHSVATGGTEEADIVSSYLGNLNTQVEQVCAELAEIPELSDGYNAVGFSQGGQFLRAVVERCQHTGPKMHTLVTMGAQHQGIMNVPECWNPSFNATPAPVCLAVQKLLGLGAYLPYVRDHIIQAQYFKDPYQMSTYLARNPFLPDINNEITRNATYKENLASLTKLVLFRFKNDVTVVPRDSAWFGFYDGDKLSQLRDMPIYQEDWIGLKELDESSRLLLEECPGGHMHFTLAWFEEHIIIPYLTAST